MADNFWVDLAKSVLKGAADEAGRDIVRVTTQKIKDYVADRKEKKKPRIVS